VALGSHFNQTDGVFSYHFRLRLAAHESGAPRTIVINVPTPRINSYTIYSSSSSATATNIKSTLVATVPATVHVAWCYPAIQIVEQPQYQALKPGDDAVFSVGAEGQALVYQWRRDTVALTNGGRVSGADAADLTISDVGLVDQGEYDCVVTGACGQLVSDAAWLTCTPLITSQPIESTWLYPGLQLTLGVPPGAPYTYQWRRNGQGLLNYPGLFEGATSRELTILAADPSIPGDFDCLVTDECGYVESNVATVQCPGDFDLNGFVNGDDFDAFRYEFILGNEAADVDHNGFVNGDDADYYLEHFVLGC